jgi:hypothetical protein
VFAPSNAGKNLKRIEGGVRSTEKLVKNTVVGTAKFVGDFATMSMSDAAADRMVARGQGIADFANDPLDAITNAHTTTADQILAAEQRGDYIASGEAAAGTAQADFLAVYGATGLGRAALSRMAPSVALESGAYSSAWFAENPLLASVESSASSTARVFSGGAHRLLSTDGLERHHMPADSVSPLSKGRGPAIEMIPEDHMMTASWGRSRTAMNYRARQQQLISEGRFAEAMQMDINDARILFSAKYEDAIQRMLGYASTLPESQLRPGSTAARVKMR